MTTKRNEKPTKFTGLILIHQQLNEHDEIHQKSDHFP